VENILGTTQREPRPEPWNKGKLVGQKAPLKLKDIWALRVRLQMANRIRELALLNSASTASCAGATLSSSRCATSATASRSPLERS